MTVMPKRAVVTGASSGIGQAAVRRLRATGWDVIAVARRGDRLAKLSAETGAVAYPCDITDGEGVGALSADLANAPLHALINNAGGARGADSVAVGDADDWRWMFDVNVMGTLAITQALLPALIESGRGDLVFVTSTAGHDTYPGGGGYVAAKHAERTLANTLRLELVGKPVRVIEIAPGMVKTEEFALNRLGSSESADAVYQGVEEPLVAEDVAEAIGWCIDLPHHVNVDSMILRPRAQVSNTQVHRG